MCRIVGYGYLLCPLTRAMETLSATEHLSSFYPPHVAAAQDRVCTETFTSDRGKVSLILVWVSVSDTQLREGRKSIQVRQ